MSAPLPPTDMIGDRKSLEEEARRVLRRLVEPGALMAVAPELNKAAVLRDMPDGRSLRTAVVERAVAEAFALNEWITVAGVTGRIARYRITGAGRALLKRLLAEEESAEAQPFAEQHRDWGTRDSEDPETGARRQMRYNMAESPVVALSRRRDKDGKPFLSAELVAAAERLREDFELAQMGPRVAQNWERFLTAGCSSSASTGGTHRGSEGARDRVARALRDLGPGLGDTALRCCCYLEGLEVTEQKMGWSARSGKIVLRIALMRLARHYAETYDERAQMIG